MVEQPYCKVNEDRKCYKHGPREKNSKEVWRVKEGKEKKEWRVIKEKQTYAGAVKKSPQGVWKGSIIETKQQVIPWMSNSVVGYILADLSYNQLCEEFFMEG